MQSLSHQFLTWCRSKPADEEYDYTDCFGCAFAQFLTANGYSDWPNVSCNGWYDRDRKRQPMPAFVEGAVSRADFSLPNYGRTFGALVDRLEAALFERVSA